MVDRLVAYGGSSGAGGRWICMAIALDGADRARNATRDHSTRAIAAVRVRPRTQRSSYRLCGIARWTETTVAAIPGGEQDGGATSVRNGRRRISVLVRGQPIHWL